VTLLCADIKFARAAHLLLAFAAGYIAEASSCARAVA